MNGYNGFWHGAPLVSLGNPSHRLISNTISLKSSCPLTKVKTHKSFCPLTNSDVRKYPYVYFHDFFYFDKNSP